MSKKLQKRAEELGLQNKKKHIFICCGSKDGKCIGHKKGKAAWTHLKEKIKELKLDGKVLRTKADCFGICTKGPIAVVYPEGIWYHGCTPKLIDKILEEHIINGKPLEEKRIV